LELFRGLFVQPPADPSSLERFSRGRRNSSGLLVHVDSRNGTVFQQYNNRRRPRSLQDVYHVYFLLRQKLVQDLLLNIMDEAENWLKTSTIRNDLIMVPEPASGQHYVTSPPILGNGKRPVRKVIFTIKSHDQGWSYFPEHHGTYDHSWTWFETRVIDKDGKERDDREDVLKLTYNVHAIPELRTHTIVCESRGDGKHAKWVRGLREGDSIVVVPMARFPGWINFVHSEYSQCAVLPKYCC
jgi:hypothetical protein